MAGIGTSGPLTDVWSSSNGVSWTQSTAADAFGARFGQTSVTFGAPASIWVIGGQTTGGNNNDVWASKDGFNRNQVLANGIAGFDGRYGHASVVYNGKIW